MWGMTPRSLALARTLISRLRPFERSVRSDPKPDAAGVREQRGQLVEKILFTEVGLTDYAKAQLVAMAMPRITEQRHEAERDLHEFAEFLDKHLDWSALT